MKTKLNFITKTLLLIFLVLCTSICFAQRKVTISGTFFYIFYPNGETLLSNGASHTIPAMKGHIEVTVPAEVEILIYQNMGNGGRTYFLQNSGTSRSEDKKYILRGSYGGPDYIIEMKYPETKMINKTIVYNIDFYYYDTVYAPDKELNNTKETAISMSENTSYEGWGFSYDGGDNGDDYYKIVAPKRGTYVITTKGHGTQPELLSSKVYFSGNLKNHLSHYSEGGNTPTVKVYCVDKGDEFFILAQNQFNSYTMNYIVEESIDDIDIEPNNTFETAFELSENSLGKGTIGYGEISGLLPKDNEDFYKIIPTKNGKLVVNFKEKIDVKANYISFYVKEIDGSISRLNTKDLTADNQTLEIDCASLAKTYYLKVNQNRFDNSYPSYLCCNAYEVSWNIQNTTNAGCGFLNTTDFENSVSLNIYPNPTTSILNIQSADNAIIDSVTLFDLMGKIILQQTKSPNQINVEGLTSGTYIIEAISGDKKRISKFVKE